MKDAKDNKERLFFPGSVPANITPSHFWAVVSHLSRKAEARNDRGERTDDPLPLVFLESPAQIVTKKCAVRLVLSEPRKREKERERHFVKARPS